MRRVPAFALLNLVLAGGILADEPDPRIADALKVTTEAAEHYEFRLADESAEKLTFHPKSLLRWSNPVIGVIYGNVFVWTRNGRPEVIGSILQWYEPHKHSTHEFHSLSTGSIEGSHDGQVVWKTHKPGLDFKPLSSGPLVDQSPLVRLRQMRSIVRQLKVSSTNKEGGQYNLRLLTQPLYRYGDKKSDVVDGALFSFVQGTDPEVIAVLEARKGESGDLQWHLALVRMAALEFSAEFRGQKYWQVEAVPYSIAMKGKEAYSLYRFRRKKDESN